MQEYRKNGLSPPYSKMQISTWVTLPTLVLEFLFFCSPVIPSLAASIAATVVFVLFAVASAYYGLMATITDPMDPYLAKELKAQEAESAREPGSAKPSGCLALFYKEPDFSEGHGEEGHEGGEDGPTKYCWVCETNVMQHSMHCKYCNKCVSHFDHHCQWLNSCVGKANYPFFNKTLWSITGLLLVHIAVMAGIVIDIFLKGETEAEANGWFQADLSILVAAVNIFFIVFDMVALSLILQLLWFHIGLQRKKLTTYQYILKSNEEKREQRKIAEARQAKRVVAVGRARRDRNSCLALRLQWGSYCTICDPLEDDAVEHSPGETIDGSDDTAGRAPVDPFALAPNETEDEDGFGPATDESKEVQLRE